MSRAKQFYREIINGLFYGYPPCCVFWFALGHLLGASRQAVRRGGVDCVRWGHDGPEGYSYVPCCRWKHPATRPWGQYRTSVQRHLRSRLG